MATVTMWARDFQNSNVPPVCAITGKPAECWQKFGFRSAPRGTEIPEAGLELVAGPVAMLFAELVLLRAKGYLPLTRGMRRVVRVVRFIPAPVLVVGLVFTFSWDMFHSGTVSAIGFAVFVLAMPAGLLAKRRIEPQGSLVRINGILILKLTNVHPNFVVAEQASIRHDLEVGNWPPGFVGPGPVPLRFREPLVELVQRIADRELDGLVHTGDDGALTNLSARLEDCSKRLMPPPPEVWRLAQGGKRAGEQDVWWVILPLRTWDGAVDELSLAVTLRERDDQVTFQIDDLYGDVAVRDSL